MTVTAHRRTPLQARSNKTVEEILDAAAFLLRTVPFEEITTSRLAEQAGISVGALYRFYSDKQEIFDAIAVRELDGFRTLIEQVFTARQLIFSPRKVLGRVLDAYIDFLESRPTSASWLWAITSATGRARTSRTRKPAPAGFWAICWLKNMDGGRERKCSCASASRRKRATG